MNGPQVYMYPPDSETHFHLPPHPIPMCCPRAPDFWYPASCTELALAIYFTYIFQCYYLKSSHSHFLTLSPKSLLHLCLLCCPACRIVVTVFLNFIYICVNIQYLFFSFWFTSLCIIFILQLYQYTRSICKCNNVHFILVWRNRILDNKYLILENV